MNQIKFIEVSNYPDIEIGLVAPKYFRDDFSPGKKFKKHPRLRAKTYVLSPFLSNIPNKSISLHFYPNWERVVKEFEPDIIHVEEEPWSLSAFQFAVIKGRAKFLFFTEQNLFKRYPYPFSQFEQYVYRKSSCAIAVSATARNVLLKKGYQKKIFVIPHEVDVKVFFKKASRELREKLHLDGFVVGYVGRLVKEKGVEVLVKAIQRLSKHRISLLIVGSGPEVIKLQKLVNDLNLKENTHIVESIPHSEVPTYLNCMDVLTLPSITIRNWREQFGRVIIEALACEVPVIGSNCGEIPNIIKKTKGGVIFREGDVDDLARKLAKFVCFPEEAKKFAKEGREEVLTNYSCESNAKKLYSVYKYALNSSTDI